jgi:hypothetical protein
MRIFAVALEGAIELACLTGFLTVVIVGFGLAIGHI